MEAGLVHELRPLEPGQQLEELTVSVQRGLFTHLGGQAQLPAKALLSAELPAQVGLDLELVVEGLVLLGRHEDGVGVATLGALHPLRPIGGQPWLAVEVYVNRDALNRLPLQWICSTLGLLKWPSASPFGRYRTQGCRRLSVRLRGMPFDQISKGFPDAPLRLQEARSALSCLCERHHLLGFHCHVLLPAPSRGTTLGHGSWNHAHNG
mmetsp:Transcript_81516/g.189335  ORF Transcript_81516/g.189335 Transcript_81516/m.189335 type:complete len:208 (-) Transcript_81516:23-646(-)